MARCRSPLHIELTKEERVTLERLSRALAVPHRIVVRAKIVLMVANGATISGIATALHVQRAIVRKWAERFIHKRLDALDDAYRSGRPARFSP